MSRHRFVMRGGELVELDLDAPLPPRVAPYVVSDISPYRSVITREPITSRSAHRDHLRRHGAIEVGNEMPRAQKEALPPLRQDLAAAFEASTERHAEAQAISDRATAAGPILRILP
jgi:hypothetical protein